MKTAALSEIKRELQTLPEEALLKIIVRLATYRKENKELLHYLLFESHDEAAYANAVREEVTAEFREVNTASLYFARKNIRRILRNVKKYIRHSGNKLTEVEVLIHFCECMNALKLPRGDSKVLMNLYERQIAAIEKALATLHEDLQSDYRPRIEQLNPEK